MLGTLLPLHSSTAQRNTNSSYHIILTVLSRVECNWVCHLVVTRSPPETSNAVVIMMAIAQMHYGVSRKPRPFLTF